MGFNIILFYILKLYQIFIWTFIIMLFHEANYTRLSQYNVLWRFTCLPFHVQNKEFIYILYIYIYIYIYVIIIIYVKVLVTQLCSALCDPTDCSPPGYSVHLILQARILEWVAISFSRGSSWPRDQTPASCIAGWFTTDWATREALLLCFSYISYGWGRFFSF